MILKEYLVYIVITNENLFCEVFVDLRSAMKYVSMVSLRKGTNDHYIKEFSAQPYLNQVMMCKKEIHLKYDMKEVFEISESLEDYFIEKIVS
jgi:UDP-2,3-diacylglucosamine pyrophosphatase LpxH